MTNLEETLTMVAAQIRADAKQLIAFAAEDTLGGFHIDEAQRRWPMGSAWEVELKILYALVRWTKPEKIVECGGWRGASATHLAQAVKMNGVGHVYSVDNGSEGGIHGELIPTFLQEFITLYKEDARVWLAAQPAQSIGFLFEDASHDVGLVTEITRLALVKCEPTALYVNHDAMKDFYYDGNYLENIKNPNWKPPFSPVGSWVREGLARGGAYATGYLAEPSDCGLAITVIPGVKKVDIVTQGKGNPVAQSEPLHNIQGQLASDHLAALSQVGNANIESQSEPPPVSDIKVSRVTFRNDVATDIVEAHAKGEEDTKETPVKKPRGKGRKKAE